MTDKSRTRVYTIDELWESGEWDHGHEFVDHSAYIKLQEELAEARMALENIKTEGVVSIQCPDGIKNCAVNHLKFNKQANIAREFLTKYPKKEG